MGGLKTVKDIDVAGRRVLMRADYNVPIKDGRVLEDYRISQSLPTIEHLLKEGCNGLVIIAHMGRPNGRADKALSLEPVATHLQRLLGKKVGFVDDCVGEEVVKAAKKLKTGDILLLENLRFHAGEEANQKDFAKEVVEAAGAQLFVQDGFGEVHRKHASTSAIASLLPSAAGLLLEKEVYSISNFVKDPPRPLTIVIGGAKVSTKIDFIKKFIEMADSVVIAGAMANTFWAAEGHKVGKSLIEKDVLADAKEIMKLAKKMELKRAFHFIIPKDVVVSKTKDGLSPTRVVDISYSLADIEAYPRLPRSASYTVGADERIVDVGPVTAARIAGMLQISRTVIWNGACGITEVHGIGGAADPFSHGTRVVVDAITGASQHHQNKPKSLVGGGDTVSYVEHNNLLEEFNFVSTGGGAMLELLAGKKLPGVEALAARPADRQNRPR